MRGSEGGSKGITRVSFFWCSSFDLIAINPEIKSGYANIATFDVITNMGISIASRVERAIANAVDNPSPRIEINPIAAGFCANLVAAKNVVAFIFKSLNALARCVAVFLPCSYIITISAKVCQGISQ